MIAIISIIALILMLMFFYQTGKMNEQYDKNAEFISKEIIVDNFEILDI